MKKILKFRTFSALLLTFAMFFASCEKKPQPFLTVDETPITAIAKAGTYIITVSSNGEWTAIVENANAHAWCTLSDASGSNNGTITVNIAENTLFVPRSATVKITLGNLTKFVVINQEQDYPAEVSPTAYSLGRFYQCFWGSLLFPPTTDENPIIINSEADLQNYFPACGTGNYLAIDFSQHTLLIVSGRAGRAVNMDAVETFFFQNPENKSNYTLKITTIRLSTNSAPGVWIAAYLIPKLPQSVNITLDVEYLYDYYDDTFFEHDESASIIGKWQLIISRTSGFMAPNMINDYISHNIVYEFKLDGTLTISTKQGSCVNYSYSIGCDDMENGMPGLPYGLTIDGRTFWYSISLERLIIDDSPLDGDTRYFVKIN
jgi:hypothetical protein